MEDFIHLHVHSQYSLLDGQASIQKMVEKAIGNEMRGMALTDHGNMFGVKDFFDCCNSVNKKRKKEGLEPFKPIFGCEVYVARRKKEQMSDPTIDRSGNHLIVCGSSEDAAHEGKRLQKPDKACFPCLGGRFLFQAQNGS